MMICRIEWMFIMLTMINGQLYDNDTINDGNVTAASRRTYQITTILDQLLKDYDAQIRPNFGGKETFSGNSNQNFVLIEGPTVINFDILVSSFGPIQDMDMVCS